MNVSELVVAAIILLSCALLCYSPYLYLFLRGWILERRKKTGDNEQKPRR